MTLISWLRSEVKRWLYSGANLITLTRLPMLVCVQWALFALLTDVLPAELPPTLFCLGVVSTGLMLMIWDSISIIWVFWLILTAVACRWGMTWNEPKSKEALFLFLTSMQVIGMITDGLDGRFARKRSRDRKGTSEGQFLDQFVDKIFVWVTWWVFTILIWMLFAEIWYLMVLLAVWALASSYLFWLDVRSCRKHFGNYLNDRGKDYNPDSGAKKPGKIKFVMENVSICAGLLSLIFVLNIYEVATIHPRLALVLGSLHIAVALIALAWSIRLARSSLRMRGVMKSKTEGSLSPPFPAAEAVVGSED